MINDDALVDAFNDCIDKMATGQSVDDCLRTYPEYASQLEPMLEAGGLAVRAQVDSAEIAHALVRAHPRFEQALQTKLTVFNAYPLRRLAALAATLILVLGIFAGGTVVVAQDSLPGDYLYPVKRWSESVRLSVSDDDTDLQEKFNQRRINETRDLLTLQRQAEVTFEGEIVMTQEGGWQIAGLDLLIDVDMRTQAQHMLQTDYRVQLRAMTTVDGELAALSIQPTKPLEPQVVPSGKQTPTMTTVPTLPPSPTLEATPSRTTTATPTPIRNSNGGQQPSQPACVISPPDGWVAYQLQAGDTLSGLMAGTGASMEDIRRVNCIGNSHQYTQGQVIYLPHLPPPKSTPVHQGEGGRNENPGNTGATPANGGGGGKP
jgi:hypothetical protein